MTPILHAMIDRATERATKWKGVKVKDLPDPLQLKERTILGSYSYTMQVHRIRLLRQSCLITLTEGLQETPSSIARDYLVLSYKRSPRITHDQAVSIGAYDDPEEEDMRKRQLKPFPLYAEPGKFEHGFYIDIKSTYWAIMQVAGWNVDYYPGEWIAGGRPPKDFPFPDHKQARSCLVSVARPGKMLCYEPVGKFPEIKGGSPVINLSISKLISDVLNSIAEEAVKMGALYANTDGYVMPNEKSAAYCAQMIRDWGLDPRIKGEGRGSVRGVGSYKVGELVSEPFRMKSVIESHRGIYAPEYKKWLQTRFAKIAAY